MRICLLLLAASLPLSVHAQGFGALRWDYVAASVVLPESDEPGYEVEGSIGVTNRLVVFGGLTDFEPTDDNELRTFRIGVGHRWNVRPSMDLMASLSYADNEINQTGSSDNAEEGLILGMHIRGWITQRLELNGALLLDNSLGSNTDTIVEFGAEFTRRRNVSYGGRYRAGEDDSTLLLGVHFYFGASRR